MHEQYAALIDVLTRDGYLKTAEIINAFKAIDRADFVLPEWKAQAYENIPLPIGLNQTISQPLVVAFMIELLEPKQGEKILEIGAGSGWQTAILASLVSKSESGAHTHVPNIISGETRMQEAEAHSRRSPLVIAIEHLQELKEMAERNVAKYDFIASGIVRVIRGDGSRGYKKEAPYDKIIAGAAAKGNVPKAWREQLKIGGRIVAPIEQAIHVIEKTSKTEYKEKEYFGFSFVPLIAAKEKGNGD